VLVIQDRGRTERVPVTEVLYFKAELKYITVRTAASSYILDRLAERAWKTATAPQFPAGAPQCAGVAAVRCGRWRSTSTPERARAGRCA
jgi:hypothetical protein